MDELWLHHQKGGKRKKKGYFVSCCYISCYRKEENNLFPMAVIAKTKDISLNLKQNKLNLDMREKTCQGEENKALHSLSRL